MLKAIIADDESRVLQLIKKLVNWDDLGIQLVGEADNGIAAFELIRSENPDIVITDIRMPGLDGLEIVRKTREMNSKTSFIIVSGYKHFEYAQNALRYGVEEYLVKPINKEELNGILIRLRDRHLENNGRLESDKLIKSQLERSREKLRKQFINSMVFEPEKLIHRDLDEINAEYQFKFREGYFQAIVLKVDKKFKDIDANHVYSVTDKIPEIVERSLHDRCSELFATRVDSKIICVYNFNQQCADIIKKSLKNIFDDVTRYLDTYSYFDLTIGVGSVETGLYTVTKSIQTALDSIKCRVVLGVDRIIDISTYDYKTIPVQEIITSDKESQFIHLVEVFDTEGLKRWIESIFDSVSEQKNTSPCVLFDISQEITDIFFQSIKKLNLQSEDKASFKNRLVQELDNSKSVADIKNCVFALVNDYLDSYLQSKRIQDSKPIRIAKQYVSEHYRDQVNLEDIAKLVHLNPVYFSVIFKKEVGINFSDYLINFRLNVAKSLLKDTRHNVYEIAEMVGYTDAKYFSKLFSKVVGIKPQDYRKLYS